jgi:hypothetical protein
MKEKSSSIAITKSNTTAKTIMVRSPSLDISQENFGDFGEITFLRSCNTQFHILHSKTEFLSGKTDL